MVYGGRGATMTYVRIGRVISSVVVFNGPTNVPGIHNNRSDISERTRSPLRVDSVTIYPEAWPFVLAFYNKILKIK